MVNRNFIAFLLLISTASAFATIGQPYTSRWHLNGVYDNLLEWSPESDPDAKFNRGSVLLRNRFDSSLMQVNPDARGGEGRIMPLACLRETDTNYITSQNRNWMEGYNFGYWQYVDTMVSWGGSNGYGLIQPPSGDSIDAAHKNGVPILGNIFLPPNAYGGQVSWVEEFVRKDGDRFPYADKLIEVAGYYGFDGWFINQETNGCSAQVATAMREFMKYYYANSSGLQICWYDSMIESGGISWQNMLNSYNDSFLQDGNDLVSDSMFLNFWWYNSNRLSDSRQNAINLGRDPYDLFAGIDVEGGGYYTSGLDWESLFPSGEAHNVSLGIYRPDWCYKYSGSLGQYYDQATNFWSGLNKDPSVTTTSTEGWKGIASYVPAKSVIDEVPFVTNFCTGHGYDFYIDGEKESTKDWNYLSIQDVLPTWRWIVKSSGIKLVPEIDFTDSYYGGNCLKVTGIINANNDIPLYMTNLYVEDDTKVSITFRSPASGVYNRMRLAVTFADNLATPVYYSLGLTKSSWLTKEFSLASHAGRTIAKIGLNFTRTNSVVYNYEIKVGRIAVTNGLSPAPLPPSNASVIQYYPTSNSIRLKWEHSISDVCYYNLYRKMANGSLKYLGTTPNNYYYVQSLGDDSDDSEICIETIDTAFKVSEFESVPINVYSSDLIAYWPFDEGNMDTAFDLASLNDGQIYNAYWTDDAILGKALDFNGDAGVIVPDSSLIRPDNNFTISTWINADSWKQYAWQGTILSTDGGGDGDKGYVLRCGENGKLSFNISLDGTWTEVLSEGNLQLGQWYHVAAVYAGSSLRIYINGSLNASKVINGSIRLGEYDIHIGDGAFWEGRNFDGLIDEVSIWNKALSLSEIQDIYYQNESLLSWHVTDLLPEDEEIKVANFTDLSYVVGSRASSYDIYLGISYENVANATEFSDELKINQDITKNIFTPGRLNSYTTYYWRIDPVLPNGVKPKGSVLSFTTAHIGDLDDDGIVGIGDLLYLTNSWLNVCETSDWCLGSDINHDGRVDFEDFAEFAQFWIN